MKWLKAEPLILLSQKVSGSLQRHDQRQERGGNGGNPQGMGVQRPRGKEPGRGAGAILLLARLTLSLLLYPGALKDRPGHFTYLDGVLE